MILFVTFRLKQKQEKITSLSLSPPDHLWLTAQQAPKMHISELSSMDTLPTRYISGFQIRNYQDALFWWVVYGVVASFSSVWRTPMWLWRRPSVFSILAVLYNFICIFIFYGSKLHVEHKSGFHAELFNSTLIMRNVKLHSNFTRLMRVGAVFRSLILLNPLIQFGKVLTQVKPGVDSNLI